MFRRRPEYFVLSMLFVVLLAAGSVYMALTLPSGANGAKNGKVEDIVERTSEVMGLDAETAEKAELRIRKGI